jgi:hypothetical protein
MKALNIIQILLDILIAIGYIIGLIPLGYLLAMWWVIPLSVVVLVISIIARNKTWIINLLNLIMAVLSVIPILGFLPRVLGFILTAVSAIKAGIEMF